MKNLMVYILAAMMLISFSQCSKDGPQGPEGERGERGERGKQGEKGAKGDDGTSILSGKGAPSSSLGDVGDFYLDLSSSNLYGPKTSSGWGTAVSIQGKKGDKGSKGDKGDRGAKGDKGDKGATGAKGDKGNKGDRGATGAKGDKGATGAKGQDGSQFLSGTSTPSSSLGNVGDFYFRTSTSVLYGPKTSSGWGSGTSLKGPKGDKGDKGEDGNANVRSSGWVALTSSKWDTRGGGASPDDILSIPYSTNSFYGLSKSEVDGVVLVYVRGLKRSRPTDVYMLPVKDEVRQNGKLTTLELRFNHSGDLDYALWLDLFVGLQGSNSWDTSYMKNTYLPALEWKIVTIPPNVAKAEKNKLDRMDFNKYEEVKSYFNLED